jgi:Domain of unknown function (DUF4287)/Domain of unknown function (DUF5655)
MSFQAYLDNIKFKTGKSPEDFLKLAEKKGLLKTEVKAGEIVAWLKNDFELGHGHAMAIYNVFKSASQPKTSIDQKIDKHFSRKKSSWRKTFDSLIGKLNKYGDDVKIASTSSYLSILRDKKKFAIVQVTADRMDIGIKLKQNKPTNRFEPAGTWNNMVTHRVRISDPKEIDAELLKWLKQAYENA